jgi:hypothetical protein
MVYFSGFKPSLACGWMQYSSDLSLGQLDLPLIAEDFLSPADTFHFKLSLLLEESVVSFYMLGIASGPPDMGDLSCSSSFFWNHHCFTFPNHLSHNIVAVYVPSLSPSLLSLNCSASTFNFNYSFTPAGLSSSKGLNTMECGLSSK